MVCRNVSHVKIRILVASGHILLVKIHILLAWGDALHVKIRILVVWGSASHAKIHILVAWDPANLFNQIFQFSKADFEVQNLITKKHFHNWQVSR